MRTPGGRSEGGARWRGFDRAGGGAGGTTRPAQRTAGAAADGRWPCIAVARDMAVSCPQSPPLRHPPLPLRRQLAADSPAHPTARSKVEGREEKLTAESSQRALGSRHVAKGRAWMRISCGRSESGTCRRWEDPRRGGIFSSVATPPPLSESPWRPPPSPPTPPQTAPGSRPTPDELGTPLQPPSGAVEPGRLRRLWERRKRSAFPPGALTFHLEAWTRRSLSAEGRDAAIRACRLLDCDELLVLHGSAWLTGGGVTLVCGPAGIGKSTVLRALQRSGQGHLVEDGVLLVGVRSSRWFLVLTGANDVLDRASRIGRRFRDLMGVDFSLFQGADPEALRRAHPLRAAVLLRLSSFSFSLAAALGPRPRAPFSPSCVEVSRLLVARHAFDPSPTIRLGQAGTAEVVADIAPAAPATVAVTTVSPLGELEEIRRRLRDALLTSTA
jgi:hypothetical protein